VAEQGGNSKQYGPPPDFGTNLQFPGKFVERLFILFFIFFAFPWSFQESCPLTQDFVPPPMI
jgi:hypothetical protein